VAEDPTGPGPLADLLGIRPAFMEEGRARFDLAVRPEHLNPNRVVHGGVIYALLDTAMGGALFSTLPPGQHCTTLEVKINYLAAVTGGELRAEAGVVGLTRRTGVIEARAYGDGDRLVALATGTFYIQTVKGD
jgi:acyl-CoA thioesterase